MSATIGAAAISAGAGLLGSLFGANKQDKNAQAQRDWQEKMYLMDRDYNNVVNQRKRWEQAGLNPNLMMSGSAGSVSGSVSIAALRQAYAAQKYKEIQLANDVDFASQIEAHFGVKPKHADDTSYFIGGSSSMIDINPIVNQNLSGDGQADYKASPIGNGSSKIKFTADTYGVVMGIYRCTPVLDYAHIGIS